MLNKVILIGNVGNDPETKSLPNGNQVANFGLATSEYWKDKHGDKQTKTEWHNIVVYGDNLVNFIKQYVSKGTKLYIEGSITYEKYEDKNGIERTATKIILKGFNSALKILSSKNPDSEPKSNNNIESPIQDDEIPF